MAHPGYDPNSDFGDRLTRLVDQDRQTAAQLAGQSVLLETMAEKVTGGFERIEPKLSDFGVRFDQIGATLQAHGLQLQSLQESGGRQRSVARWAAGVASAVWWPRSWRCWAWA